MRILVLGGTSFVGRAIVADAISRGAEVTLFGRGRTGPGLFPGVPRLIGDRDTGDYAALKGWHAVVDVSGRGEPPLTRGFSAAQEAAVLAAAGDP